MRRNKPFLYSDRSRSLFGILKIDLLVGSTLIHFPLNSKDAARSMHYSSSMTVSVTLGLRRHDNVSPDSTSHVVFGDPYHTHMGSHRLTISLRPNVKKQTFGALKLENDMKSVV